MDRQKIAKAVHDIGLKNRVGTAQNLYLGTTQIRQGAAGDFTLTAQIQRAALLQTLTVSCNNEFTISEISVAGQSCLTSDSVVGGSAFGRTLYYKAASALGISVNNNMQVVVQGNTTVASNISLAVGLDPIPNGAVKTRSQQAHAYNYCHGLGTAVVPAGGASTMTSISNRAAVLGLIVLENQTGAVANSDLLVTSLKVDGLEMLAGQTGADEIPIEAFFADSTAYKDNTLGYPVNPQSRIEIGFFNHNAAAATVSGAIFLEPWKA